MDSAVPLNRYPKVLGFMYEDPDPQLWRDGFDEVLKWSKVIQVFVSNPKEFVMPQMERIVELGLRAKNDGLIPVVHGPYATSLIKEGSPVLRFTTNWIKMCLAMLNSVGLKDTPIVIHTGKPPKESIVEEVELHMLRYLERLSDSLDKARLSGYKVCFETDASRHNPVTRFPGLYQVLVKHGNPDFHITYDTEHMYAAGFHPETLLTDAEWSRIKVLHLNAIPPEVQFGSGLDRHSFTPLRTCSQGFPHRNQWEKAKELGIPVILERSDYDVVRDDLEFLSKG